jgi:hypothetical protein
MISRTGRHNLFSLARAFFNTLSSFGHLSLSCERSLQNGFPNSWPREHK